MTANYVLTSAAEADLREIIRYTGAQWGAKQTRIYLTKLTQGIDSIATGNHDRQCQR